MKIRFSLLAAAAGIALASTAAHAQTIDYGTLQDAFGQAVTTGATGKPQVQSDAPAAMRIITAAEIKASGLDNLPDILGRVAGVDVLRWGSASTDVGLRGYNQAGNPRLLVLLNGRQVYADHYALVTWSAIPVQLSEIRQIEVVKGPVGAIYGFNAVSGVVNIITYNPLYDNAGQATARIGNHGQREIGLSKAMKLTDKVGARLSAGYKEADEFNKGSLTAGEKAARDNPESSSVAAAIMAQVTDNVQAGVEVTHSNVHQYELTPSFTYNWDVFKTTSAKADIAADAGSFGLVNVTAYRTWLDLSYSSGVAVSDVETTVVQVSDLIQVNTDHTVKLSGEFRHNEMDQMLAGTGKIGYDVWAGAVMWDWKVTDQVTFTNAARVDFFSLQTDGLQTAPYGAAAFDRDMTKASLNSGLVYKPTDADTFRATYGIANQLPSLVELGGLYNPSGPGVYVAGNPAIDPTRVDSAELGYTRTLSAINGHVGINVFRQKSTDLKSFIGADVTRVGNVYALAPLNAGDSKSWGSEIELAGANAKGLNYALSYTWTDINDDLTVNQTTTTRPIKYEGSAPRHKLQGMLGYTVGSLTTQANLVYQSRRTILKAPTSFAALNPVEIDGYWSAAATIGYQFESGTEIRLSGTDLLRADTQAVPGLRTERRLYATVSQKF